MFDMEELELDCEDDEACDFIEDSELDEGSLDLEDCEDE